jgi:uncharacterized protein (DUF305 family)
MRARPLVLAATGLALTGLLAACGSSSSPTTSTNPAAASTTTSVGDTADVSFAQLMIPHHQQAVAMADLALKYGTSAEVKKLATQIQSAQGPEIAQMTAWLQAWGAPLTMPSSSSSDGMGGMDMGGVSADGMMSTQDMDALAMARGVEFDRMWLQMMITHHQGAITMANQVLATTKNAQVTQLANAIVAGQTTEIDTMKKLLAG